MFYRVPETKENSTDSVNFSKTLETQNDASNIDFSSSTETNFHMICNDNNETAFNNDDSVSFTDEVTSDDINTFPNSDDILDPTCPILDSTEQNDSIM